MEADIVFIVIEKRRAGCASIWLIGPGGKLAGGFGTGRASDPPSNVKRGCQIGLRPCRPRSSIGHQPARAASRASISPRRVAARHRVGERALNRLAFGHASQLRLVEDDPRPPGKRDQRILHQLRAIAAAVISSSADRAGQREHSDGGARPAPTSPPACRHGGPGRDPACGRRCRHCTRSTVASRDSRSA